MTQTVPGCDDAASSVALSIIIATFNARGLLADCLRSIERDPPRASYEIIVVDDASADGTSEMVRSSFPGVRLLRNDTNRHYAYSNNRAFGIARGEYLLLLNNDTIVLPGALDHMIAFLRERPDAGVIGCKLLNGDGSIQWSVKSLPNPGSALFGTRSILTRLFPNNPFTPHHLMHLGRDMTMPFAVSAGYLSSAAVMLPRRVVETVGGLDERLSYHVDADYCKRIDNLGYRAYYLPTATIIHFDHKGGTMVNRSRRFRSLIEFHRGSYIYYQKHLQKSVWSPMHALVILGLSARFVLSIASQITAELAASARVKELHSFFRIHR